MGIDLIYPTINLFQYDLRDSLGDLDGESDTRARNFYAKFDRDLTEKDIEVYRDRERVDREFNELVPTVFLPLPDNNDGFYYPVRLGDTYALQLNYSGTYKNSKVRSPNLHPQDLNFAFTDLKKVLDRDRLLPAPDEYTLGQTWLLTAFVEQLPGLLTSQDLKIQLQSCYAQVTGENFKIADLKSIERGNWLGGTLFELWQPPTSYQSSLSDSLKQHPHIIIWLFPADKFDEVNKRLPEIYHHWMRLLHYQHKIVYAYLQSQFIKQRLKSSNSQIQVISDRLKTQTRSLGKLQRLLFDTLTEFQFYSQKVRDLEAQQHTIDVDRDNYRRRCDEMSKEDAGASLQLAEFDNKYADKCYRQIQADRAHLDSGSIVLDNLSKAIQGSIQIEQTKSNHHTTLAIAAVGTGLSLSQTVNTFATPQPSTTKNISVGSIEISPLQLSLIAGLAPILLLTIYLIFDRFRSR
jgi:hypothetical protein